jgi:hypothetical protein
MRKHLPKLIAFIMSQCTACNMMLAQYVQGLILFRYCCLFTNLRPDLFDHFTMFFIIALEQGQ